MAGVMGSPVGSVQGDIRDGDGLNNYTTNGIYAIYGTPSNLPNGIGGGVGGVLIVFHTHRYTAQLFINHNMQDVCFRTLSPNGLVWKFVQLG